MNHTGDGNIVSASVENGTEDLWNMSRILPLCEPARFPYCNENNIKYVDLLRSVKLYLSLIKHYTMKTYGRAEA
jgi:hypothetical protein